MMSYIRRTLGCCAALLVPIACSESADDPQGTGGSSTSEGGGSPADGAGGSFASGGAGTGGKGTGGDPSGGAGGAGLALEVDGWGTIRCKAIDAEEYGNMICIAELSGGRTMRVAPLCAIERMDQLPYNVRTGSEPSLVLCGEGPDDQGDWDEIICWESYDEAFCVARRGDWLTMVGPACEVDTFEEEISANDPRFIACSDLSLWDEVRCYGYDSEDGAFCVARHGLYWVEIYPDCRTQEPEFPGTEVDPATVSCDVYHYYDY